MGMDSYIYKTTKEGVAKHENRVKMREDAIKELQSIDKMIHEKYPEVFKVEKDKIREMFEKIVPSDMVKRFDDLYKIYNWDFGDEESDNDTDEEIMYWRKAWGLHWWIVENCGGNHDDDNCVRIYLKKENVQSIIKELEKYVHMSILDFDVTNVEWVKGFPKNPFAKDDYWDYGQMVDTYKFFKTLENEWDDNAIYYYYTWY